MANQYRQTGSDGKPLPKKSTGWIFTDAVALAACPKCGSSKGYHCESPKGRKVWPPHSARITPNIMELGRCSGGSPHAITEAIVNGCRP